MATDALHMNIDDIESKFQVNLYRWARATMAEQVRINYPLLRLVQSGVVERFFTFIKAFGEAEQLQFADALVRRFHPSALRLTGDCLNSEEEELIAKYLNSPLPSSPYEQELMEKYLPNVSRRKTLQRWRQGTLKTLLARAVMELYSGAVLKWDGGEAHVMIAIGRLSIVTNLDIHNKWDRFRYFHRVYYGERELHPIIAPLGLWGIGGTNWDHAESPEQIDAGFRALSKHFLLALPLLSPVEYFSG